jgi:hypothetical protein
MMKDLKSTVSTTSWNYETQCNPDEAAKFKGIATRLSPFKDGSHESIQSFEYDRVVFLFQLYICTYVWKQARQEVRQHWFID